MTNRGTLKLCASQCVAGLLLLGIVVGLAVGVAMMVRSAMNDQRYLMATLLELGHEGRCDDEGQYLSLESVTRNRQRLLEILPRLKNVRALTFNSWPESFTSEYIAEGWEAIQPTDLSLLSHAKLRSLQIGGTAITDAHVEALGNQRDLEGLCIESCLATGECLRTLRPARLKGVYIGRCPMSLDGAEQLGNCTTIEHLEFDETTGLGDDHLARLRKLRNLRTLRVTGTDVTDQGFVQLAKDLPQLEYLYLFHTAVTADGLRNAARFAHWRVLRVVRSEALDGPPLDLVKDLVELMPGCEVDINIGGQEYTQRDLPEEHALME